MDCSCTIDTDIDNYCYTLHEVVIVARKEHVCQECGRKIAKGEKYEYFSSVLDGDIFIHKTCLDCLSLRDVFFTDSVCGRLWDDFYDYMEECFWEVPESCLSKVTKRTREKICWFIERNWET